MRSVNDSSLSGRQLVRAIRPLEVIDGGQQIRLGVIAERIRKDKVVCEVDGVARPRNEVVDVFRTTSNRTSAVEAPSLLYITENRFVRLQRRALRAEQELVQILAIAADSPVAVQPAHESHPRASHEKYAIEHGLECRTRAAQFVDDLLRPIEVLAFAPQWPVRRRLFDDVAEIADLIRAFDELGSSRQLRRVQKPGRRRGGRRARHRIRRRTWRRFRSCFARDLSSVTWATMAATSGPTVPRWSFDVKGTVSPRASVL